MFTAYRLRVSNLKKMRIGLCWRLLLTQLILVDLKGLTSLRLAEMSLPKLMVICACCWFYSIYSEINGSSFISGEGGVK